MQSEFFFETISKILDRRRYDTYANSVAHKTCAAPSGNAYILQLSVLFEGFICTFVGEISVVFYNLY